MDAGVKESGGLDISCPAAKAAPGRIRKLVALRLTEWGLAGLADDLTLIASELVTNAVGSTPGEEIRVRFVRETRAVVLAVWDSSDACPVRKRGLDVTAADVAPDAAALDPGHDDGTCGRGLPILELLSEECGVTPTEPCGKWVWSRVTD